MHHLTFMEILRKCLIPVYIILADDINMEFENLYDIYCLANRSNLYVTLVSGYLMCGGMKK